MTVEAQIVSAGTAVDPADSLPPRQDPIGGHEHDLHEIAKAIRGRLNGIRENMIAIGRDLHRAKALVAHGQWMPWLRAEFDMTSRTAENYMNLTERLGDRFETVSNLRLRTIYRIVSRSTPNDVLDAVIARATSEAGLTDADAIAMVAASRPARQLTLAAQTAAVEPTAEAADVDCKVTEAGHRPKPPIDPLNDWTGQAAILLTTQIKDKARLKTLTHLLPRADIELLVCRILDYLTPAP